jgi:ABC-type uncharacterized transport system permease subunit
MSKSNIHWLTLLCGMLIAVGALKWLVSSQVLTEAQLRGLAFAFLCTGAVVYAITQAVARRSRNRAAPREHLGTPGPSDGS